MEAANCKEKTSNYPNVLKIRSGFCVWIQTRKHLRTVSLRDLVLEFFWIPNFAFCLSKLLQQTKNTLSLCQKKSLLFCLRAGTLCQAISKHVLCVT